MSDSDLISVEVAYALPQQQAIVGVQVPAGTTAVEAVRQSGIEKRFADIDLDNAKLGIFGALVAPGQVLAEGDRVEIYRPLQADPKAVRKERAARVRKQREETKEP